MKLLQTSMLTRLFFSLLVILFSRNSTAQIAKGLVNPGEQVIYFDLPGQSLKSGLIEFAIQAQLTVIVDFNKVDGLKSRPVIGPYPTGKALKRLLSKTPLTFALDSAARSITIQQRPDESSIEQSSQDKEPHQSDPAVEELVVYAQRFPSRYSTISNSHLSGRYASFSSSRFINTLPSSFISDQMPTELGDALAYASSITPGSGLADSNDDYYIRGFARFGLYFDGFRLSEKGGTKLAPELIERLEILKGPSTLFYGQAEPGGIVNAIRKKPSAQSSAQLTVGTGSDGFKKANIDIGGSLWPSANLSYRLIASTKAYQHYRDTDDVERQVASASVAWEPMESTRLDASFDRYQSQQTREHGTIILAPLVAEADVVALEHPGRQARPEFDTDTTLSTLELNHHFSRHWSLNAKWTYLEEERLGIRADRDALYQNSLLLDLADLQAEDDEFDPTSIGKDDQWLPSASIYSIYDELAFESNESFLVKTKGHTTLFGFDNELNVGISLDKRFMSEAYLLEHRGDIKTIQVSVRGEVLDEVEVTFEENTEDGEIIPRVQELDFRDTGFYVLNSTQLSDSLRLSLGGRYSASEARRITNKDTKQTLKKHQKISSDFGLSYQTSDNHQFYFNYSQGFKANYHIDDIGTEIGKPELSEQLELGLKSYLFNDKLTSTAALFSIEKKNIVEVEFIEGVRTAHTDGEQKNTGFDLDFNLQATRRLNIIGALALLDPKITSERNRGDAPALAAKKQASLFAHAIVYQNARSDLSLQIGGKHVGRRYSTNTNTEHSYLAPFTSFDSGISYRWKVKNTECTLQFFAKNIFDKSYTLASEGRLRNNHANGRNYQANLSLTF